MDMDEWGIGELGNWGIGGIGELGGALETNLPIHQFTNSPNYFAKLLIFAAKQISP